MTSGRGADAGEPHVDPASRAASSAAGATATLVADAPELPDDLDGEPLVELDHPPALDVRRLGLLLTLLSLLALAGLVWVGRSDDRSDEDLLSARDGAASELADADATVELTETDASAQPSEATVDGATSNTESAAVGSRADGGADGGTNDADTAAAGTSSDGDTESTTDATSSAAPATEQADASGTDPSDTGTSGTDASGTGTSEADTGSTETSVRAPEGDVSLELEGDTVLLNGSVADAATARSLTARLAAIVGSERVRDNTTIDPAATVPSTVEVVLRDGLDFDPDDASITSRAGRDAVALLGELIEARPDAAVTVAGHTDSEGPSAYNIEIARQRVFSVLRLLVGYDVYVGDIAIELVGEAEPIATNATEAGRALNRRVEVTIDGLFTD